MIELQSLRAYFAESSSVADAFISDRSQQIEQVISLLTAAFANGGKVICCANGGLAAISSHFVAELVGRFESSDRHPLPALSLSSDHSILTALSNDFGYDQIFGRQLKAFASSHDLIILLSCSGNSSNIRVAAKVCSSLNLNCVLVRGKSQVEEFPRQSALIDILIPSGRCSVIQEVILKMLHYICYRIDLLQ